MNNKEGGSIIATHGVQVGVQQNFKDTVFRMLFSDSENLLELYNAMNNTSYRDTSELEIVTLENAVYLGYKNDIAFMINSCLNLYEHQSTYNPNMPLRNLIYVSCEYQKLVVNRTLYSSKIQKIPTPKFVVFYNGKKGICDKKILRLSDAYEIRQDDPELELQVTMLDINEGHNMDLMKQCKTLEEYSYYVACVRKYAEVMDLAEAVNNAVEECIRDGILEEFLKKNKAEVISMSIFEYDKEKEEAMLRKAERDYGYEEGLSQGIEQGIEQGIGQGIEQGVEQGILTCIRIALKHTETIEEAIVEVAGEFGVSREKVSAIWEASR